MALIYIVEDDESIREIETIALKNSGHMVGAFGSSKEFFKKLDEILPDLVLLDVMLPDESGYDIIKKLRLNSATKRLPVIMVTAKSTELDMIKGLEDGADDYIKKPFSVMELITRHFLEEQKQTRQACWMLERLNLIMKGMLLRSQESRLNLHLKNMNC